MRPLVLAAMHLVLASVAPAQPQVIPPGSAPPDRPERTFDIVGRMTESARLSLFYARMCADKGTIDLPHLLSGLSRGGNALTKELLSGKGLELPDADALDVEIPFSRASTRAIQQAINEADALGHGYVASEHLLLAILQSGVAVKGLEHQAVREVVRTRSIPEPWEPIPNTFERPAVPRHFR